MWGGRNLSVKKRPRSLETIYRKMSGIIFSVNHKNLHPFGWLLKLWKPISIFFYLATKEYWDTEFSDSLYPVSRFWILANGINLITESRGLKWGKNLLPTTWVNRSNSYGIETCEVFCPNQNDYFLCKLKWVIPFGLRVVIFKVLKLPTGEALKIPNFKSQI